MFAYSLSVNPLPCILFSKNYPLARKPRQSVGMTGATMQIPNHYFRMFRHSAVEK